MGSRAPVTENMGPCDSDTQRSQVSLHPKQQNQKAKVPQAALPRQGSGPCGELPP